MTFSDMRFKCYKYPVFGMTLIFVFRDAKGNVKTCIVLSQKKIVLFCVKNTCLLPNT